MLRQPQFALGAGTHRTQKPDLMAAVGMAYPAHPAGQHTFAVLRAVVRRQTPHAQPQHPLAGRIQQVQAPLPMRHALVQIGTGAIQAIRQEGTAHPDTQGFHHQRHHSHAMARRCHRRCIGRLQPMAVRQPGHANRRDDHRQIQAAGIGGQHRIGRQQRQRRRRIPAPAMRGRPCGPPGKRQRHGQVGIDGAAAHMHLPEPGHRTIVGAEVQPPDIQPPLPQHRDADKKQPHQHATRQAQRGSREDRYKAGMSSKPHARLLATRSVFPGWS